MFCPIVGLLAGTMHGKAFPPTGESLIRLVQVASNSTECSEGLGLSYVAVPALGQHSIPLKKLWRVGADMTCGWGFGLGVCLRLVASFASQLRSIYCLVRLVRLVQSVELLLWGLL